MQRKKTVENPFSLHYAQNSLFYKFLWAFLKNGHFLDKNKCPFSKSFLTLFFFILA
jgi:hypothetical protein